MGVVRNSIEIVGVSTEEKLIFSKGQVIEYSETENINVPEDYASIGQIFKIEIAVEIKSNRIINIPSGKIIILDGIKKVKIICSERHKDDKANIINLKLPYNTFIEFKNNNINPNKLKIHIADAYFSLLDSRRIYSHILYIIEIPYNTQNKESHHEHCGDLKAITSDSDISEEEKFMTPDDSGFVDRCEENEDIEAVTNISPAEEKDSVKNIIPRMSKVDWNSII